MIVPPTGMRVWLANVRVMTSVDLTLLDDLLLSDETPDSGMGLSDLDGFLTELMVGPELILPSEWLPHMWGGETPAFTSTEQAQAVMGVVMARYNEISAQLDRGPSGLEPVFWTSAEGEIVIAADRAEGFFEAMNLRPEARAPLIRDKTNGVMLAPILALCSDEEGNALLPMDETEAAQWRAEAPELIPGSVLVIREFWREHAALVRSPDPRAVSRKWGATRRWCTDREVVRDAPVRQPGLMSGGRRPAWRPGSCG